MFATATVHWLHFSHVLLGKLLEPQQVYTEIGSRIAAPTIQENPALIFWFLSIHHLNYTSFLLSIFAQFLAVPAASTSSEEEETAPPKRSTRTKQKQPVTAPMEAEKPSDELPKRSTRTKTKQMMSDNEGMI